VLEAAEPFEVDIEAENKRIREEIEGLRRILTELSVNEP